MFLEGGFTFHQPSRQLQKQRWVLARKKERGVDQGIRLNQGAVKIDTERRY